EHGFKRILNNQRAQAFYSKWLSQYGDDSIAQVTGTHVIVWGMSQVAMKFVEDQRVGLEPIEKSTRYVNFGSKVGGRYLYYIPKPDLERLRLVSEYKTTMDALFETYVALLPRLRIGSGRISTKRIRFSKRKHSTRFADCCPWRHSARSRSAAMPRLSNI